MKKSRILSILLCLVILFTSLGGIIASAEEKTEHLPQILVGGLGCAPVYYEGDPDKTTMFYPIDFGRAIGKLGNIGEYMKKALSKEDPDILYDVLYEWMWDCFGMLSLGTDGETYAEGITTDEIALAFNEQGNYAFDYDSRLDPVSIAHKLDEYIGWVQEDSGSEKVELVGSSYGTTVVMAYLNEYRDKWDIIDSVLLCVPSVGGINFFGELFSGKLTIDADALVSFIDGKFGLETVALALGILNKAEVLPLFLECLAVPVLKEAVFEALTDIIRDVVATLPAAWTCIQDDDYIASLEHIFGENYGSADHESAKLISKIDYYHKNVKVKAYDILEEAKKAGIKMNIICKYGNPPVPVSEDGNFAGDGIVELKIASFGATCGQYEEKLPADYKQALYTDYNFISTDGTVDASTGALPFNTWYIKGLEHGGKNEDYFKLIDAIVFEDLDVFTSEEYPQFLEVPEEDGERLIPMLPVEDKKDTSIWEDLITLVVKVVELIKSVLIK